MMIVGILRLGSSKPEAVMPPPVAGLRTPLAVQVVPSHVPCPSCLSCPPQVSCPSPSACPVAMSPSTCPAAPSPAQSAAVCTTKFVRYEASELETAWKSVAEEFSRPPRRENDWVCDEMAKQAWAPRIAAWMTTGYAFAGALAAKGDLTPFSHAALNAAASPARGIFSTVTLLDSCSGSELQIAIEPVAGLLRDVMGPCRGVVSAETRRARAPLLDLLPQLPPALDADQTLYG